MSAGNSSNCVSIGVLLEQFGDLTAHLTVQYIFFGLYSLVIMMGFSGNLLVVFTIGRNRLLHTVRNLFLVNLAISDILVALVSGTITPVTGFKKEWIFGRALCHFVPLMQGASSWVSTLTLAAIAIDRYILIVRHKKKPITRRAALCMLSGIWCAALTVSTPMFTNQHLIEAGSGNFRFCGVFCMEDWPDPSHRVYYGVAVLLLQFTTPLVIVGYCYVRIYYTLRQSSTALNRGANSSLLRQSSQRTRVRRRQRTTKMLIAMVLLFAFCWFPTVTLHALRDLGWLPRWIKKQEHFWAIATHWLAMTSTCCNPVLYALLNDQLRSAFLNKRIGINVNSTITLSTMRSRLRSVQWGSPWTRTRSVTQPRMKIQKPTRRRSFGCSTDVAMDRF